MIFILLLSILSVHSSAQFSWIQKANFGGITRYESAGFSIGNKGYFGTGAKFTPTTQYFNDFWEYDPNSNTWTQKANFLGTARYGAAAFSIGGKGFMGTGWDPANTNDFYEYDPVFNSWSPIANFIGAARYDAVGFTINTKGYVGFGYNGGTLFNDLYEYDPLFNSWTSKANLPSSARQSLATFSVSGKGYICTGSTDPITYTSIDDLWEFDPVLNTWTQKANFPAGPRYANVGFTLCDKGIVGSGWNVINTFQDFYMFDPTTNTWSPVPNWPAPARYTPDGFVIGDTAYVGLGRDGANVYYNDFWALQPVQFTASYSNINCSTFQFNCNPSGASNYTWNFGDGSTSNQQNPVHTYLSSGNFIVSVVVTNACFTDTINLSVNNVLASASANFTYSIDTCNLQVSFFNTSLNATQYQWLFGDGATSSVTSPVHQYSSAGNYLASLIALNACDTDTFAVNIVIPSVPVAQSAFSYSFAPCDSLVTFTNTSLNAVSYIWNFGDGTTSASSNPVHQYSFQGTYIITLIAQNQCSIDTFQTAININPVFPAIASFTSGNNPCDYNIAFNNQSQNASGYFWQFGDGDTSTSANPVHIYSQPGSYNVLLIAFNSCKSDSVIQSITILPPGVSQFAFSIEECSGKVQFVNQSLNAINYSWNFGDGSTDSSYNPAHSYLLPGSYIVTLIINAGTGCADTLELNIEIDYTDTARLFIPNVFTPNGDGKNEVFEIIASNECDVYHLMIFNRWGQLLYETNDILQFWDGTYNSSDVPEGVYVYILESSQKTFHGTVTVLR